MSYPDGPAVDDEAAKAAAMGFAAAASGLVLALPSMSSENRRSVHNWLNEHAIKTVDHRSYVSSRGEERRLHLEVVVSAGDDDDAKSDHTDENEHEIPGVDPAV